MTSNERLVRDLLATIELDSSLENLVAHAEALRDKGYSQECVREVFDAVRALHANGEDETVYNSILDTMDLIVGFCRRERAIFPK